MNEIHTHLYYDTLEVIYQQKRSVCCSGGIFDLMQVEQRLVCISEWNNIWSTREKNNKHHHLFGEL